MQKLRIRFNFVIIAIFILTSLSFIRLVSSEENSTAPTDDDATIGQNRKITVVKPSNGRIAVTPGSPVELVWQYTRTELDNPPVFFCGYHNKKGQFATLAVDLNGEEFQITFDIVHGDEKDLISRIKTSFAQNHDNKINERGFTISEFKSSDAGTFECAFQPTKSGSGIVYQGRIQLEVKTEIETKPNKQIETTNSKIKTQTESVISLIRKRQSMTIFGRSYPKWAVWTMVILITFILVLGVTGGFLFLRQRQQKKRRSDAEDREALLDVVSSDEDEVMEYQRQVDKQQQQLK